MWYLVPLFLCWGSFLNVIAYRLIHDLPLQINSRSLCPNCHHCISWYDLIPLLSWINLQGKCRHCHNKISPLYPMIEGLTTICLWALFSLIQPQYWLVYFIFISALIITIRTDLETMQISRLVTLCLIPLPITLSLLFYASHPLIPLSLSSVMIGALFGYLILWLINKLFYWYSGQNGLGEGDFELLACIGAFIGPAGAWFSLAIGSIAGALTGLILIILHQAPTSRLLPFGPFLALGALTYLLFQDKLFQLILG